MIPPVPGYSDYPSPYSAGTTPLPWTCLPFPGGMRMMAVASLTPSTLRSRRKGVSRTVSSRIGCLGTFLPVIVDGNARWARRRGLPPYAGHEADLRLLRELVWRCSDWGIKVLTVFAFFSDNWYRPKAEVDFLMGLLERVIRMELDSFVRDGVKICVIGDSSKLPSSLQKAIAYAEEATRSNSRMQLIIAVSYSGKYDIMLSCKSIARKVKDGILQVEDIINENLIERELETSCSEYPYPDLLIRTSGELRVSNFLLWQLAYAEHFFA